MERVWSENPLHPLHSYSLGERTITLVMDMTVREVLSVTPNDRRSRRFTAAFFRYRINRAHRVPSHARPHVDLFIFFFYRTSDGVTTAITLCLRNVNTDRGKIERRSKAVFFFLFFFLVRIKAEAALLRTTRTTTICFASDPWHPTPVRQSRYCFGTKLENKHCAHR